MAKTKLEDVLSLVTVFRGLSRKQLKALAGHWEVADFMADHAIVRKGDAGDAFYVVLTGQAKVMSGKRFLARLLPGDHFGEIAVIDGGVRTASVISETPMTLAILSQKDFRIAMREDPELAYHMMKELAKMFRRVDANLAE
ncbi:MAG: cyclic nucleotide-binding domain-containing protein [Actinomycetota bacterium]